MLVVAIKTARTTRVYATRCNVLEALNDLRKAAESRERLLYARRILAGFDAEDQVESATIIVKPSEPYCFNLEDSVQVNYNSGPEYYRMRELVRLFSDLA